METTTYTMRQRVKHSALTFGRIMPWLIIIGVIWFLVNKPSQDIKIEEGGTANIYNQPKRFFIPFTEVGVRQWQGDLETYIGGGIKIEW